jgi:hypothetical protein
MAKTMGFLGALLETKDDDEADTPYLFKMAKKQNTKKMDRDKGKMKPILPTLDEMYTRLHKEFKTLRSCNMNKRDLVCYIKLKESKSESSKILSFWEGV